jgi:diacylglycerol kinase family enzyme
MKVLFVINPIAGGTDHEENIKSIRALAKKAGYKTEYLLTSGKNDEENLKRCIVRFEPDRVIVGGGDGTIRMVAKNLMASGITMGILPLGSANGLATALVIPQNPLEALEKNFQSTRVRTIDMLKFNDEHLCIHLADIGANALLVKKYEESGVRGMMGYAKNFVSAIQETEPRKIIVRTADGITTKVGIMMAFANAHKYGTGVQISEGSVSDGKFEICNVEKFALDDAVIAGLTILNVFLDKNMFSDVISCPEAEIEVDKKTHFQIDGEYMGMVDHLKIEIIPGCIKLLV